MAEVIQHNFILCIMELLTILILCYLSLKVYPLLTMKIILIICSIFIMFCPYLLNNISAPYQLFLMQFIMLLWCGVVFVFPICYKSLPVFKRFTCASMTSAVSRALMFIITSFGFVYFTDHFGNWGLWFIMIPAIIASAYGLRHFEKLVKECGNYPIGWLAEKKTIT